MDLGGRHVTYSNEFSHCIEACVMDKLSASFYSCAHLRPPPATPSGLFCPFLKRHIPERFFQFHATTPDSLQACILYRRKPFRDYS